MDIFGQLAPSVVFFENLRFHKLAKQSVLMCTVKLKIVDTLASLLCKICTECARHMHGELTPFLNGSKFCNCVVRSCRAVELCSQCAVTILYLEKKHCSST